MKSQQAVPAAILSRDPAQSGRFAAIDFETADNGRDSACALGVVVVDGTHVVREESFLIRPPRREFLFTWVHGITWEHVAGAPLFREVWAEVMPLLDGVDFLAAHNAGFDRSVLYACCHVASLAKPEHRFQCTARLARRGWGLSPAALPDVCLHLGIALRHHEAKSDARACAEILIAARKQGVPLSPWLGTYRGRLPETTL